MLSLFYFRTISDPGPTTSSSIPQDVTHQNCTDNVPTSLNTTSDTTLNGKNSAFVQASATNSSSNTNIKGNIGARKYDSFDPDSALDIEDDQNKCVHEGDDPAASQNAGKEHSEESHTSQVRASFKYGNCILVLRCLFPCLSLMLSKAW